MAISVARRVAKGEVQVQQTREPNDPYLKFHLKG